MKIIWYRISPKCSDKWKDEASREYVERPVHLIREQDKQCMVCLKSYADAENWVRDYQERMGKDWRVVNISTLKKSSDLALNHLSKILGRIRV